MARRLALAMFLLALAAAPAAQGSTCRPIALPFDYSAYLPEVELVIAELATLPGNTTILAGHYHDGAQTVHPALLVKDDDSAWTAIPLPFAGSAVGNLATVGSDSAWAIIQYRQEGLEVAEELLRSRDGGRSWCAVSLKGVTTLNTAASLRFFDHDHGLMIVTDAPFGTARAVYQTADGGDTWQRLWDTDPALPENIETDFAYPQDEPPPHAPVWRLDADLYRISGLLRIRTDILHQVVERLDFAQGPDWVEIERIDRYRPTAELAADR